MQSWAGASQYIPGDSALWQIVIVWFLIVLGLVVVARTVAWVVRPGWRVHLGETGWAVTVWAGGVLLLWSASAWTVLDRRGAGQAWRAVSAASLALAATALVGVVVAALALTVPRLTASPARRGAIGASVAVLVVVAAAVAAGPLAEGARAGASAAARQRMADAGYAATAFTTLAGALMTGVALGARLRVRVTAVGPDGQENRAAAAFVTEHLGRMGRDHPRGLDAPEGTDVQSLPEQALTQMGDERTAIVAAVIGAFRSLVAVTPWRARVVLVGDGNATVEVRRNGAQAGSALVQRSALGLDGTGPPHGPSPGTEAGPGYGDVLTAAAAYVLLQLAQRHPALTEGLNGARDWRGLACQVLAGTPPWRDDPAVAERLFAEAVEADPGNEAAWLGYLYHRAGTRVGTVDRERAYIRRLECLDARLTRAPRPPDDLALRVRVKVSLAGARLNLARLLTDAADGARAAGQVRRARRDLSALARLLAEDRGDSLGPLGERTSFAMRALARALDALPQPPPPGCRLPVPVTPWRTRIAVAGPAPSLSGHYLRACVLVARAARPGAERDALFAWALDDLDLALGLPSLRAEVPADPSLRALREHPVYGPRLAALLDRPGLAGIAAFAPLADGLARNGVRHPEELLARTHGDGLGALATSLGVPPGTVEWMRRVCELVVSCPEPWHAVAWTDLLTRDGIDTARALAAAASDPARMARLRRLAWTVDAPPVTPDGLVAWADRLDRLDGLIRGRTSRPAGSYEEVVLHWI